MSEPAPAGRRNRTVLAVVATAVVLVAVVAVVRAVTGPHDDTSSPAAGSSLSTPTTSPSSHDTSSARPVPSTSLGTSLTPGSGATEPDPAVRTKKAVPLDATAHFGTGLTVRVARITPITGRASAPGEVGGPALRIQLLAHNASGRPISLDRSVVFVSYGADRTPAGELSTGEKRFNGTVAPGAERRGTYVFTVPQDQRDDVRVEVSYTGKAPTVALQGPA
jgi:hypothetical protein